MPSRRLALCGAYPVFLIATACGCQVLHSYRPAAVLVRDIETKKPIPGAEVLIAYPLAGSPLAPRASSTETKNDGIARLQAAPNEEGEIVIEASAKGYLSEHLKVKPEAIEQLEPAHWFEDTDRRPANFVLELYSEPQFSVELVLPIAYHGLVKAEVQVLENAPWLPGQRCFSYPVSLSGEVAVKGPPPLQRVFAPGFRARYADGAPLDNKMDLLKTGFRWLKSEGNRHYFVVGTQPEYDSLCKQYLTEESGAVRSSSEGGSGGSRSGRRRRGNTASSQ